MTYLFTSQQYAFNFDGFRVVGPERVAGAVKHLQTYPDLAIDCETTGLSFIDDSLLLVQIATDTGDVYLFDARDCDISLLQPLAAGRTFLLHNAKFDYKFLRRAGFRLESVYDSMLAEKVLHTGLTGVSHALAATMERRLGVELDKTQQTSFIGHSGPFTLAQLQYGAEDVTRLHDLRDVQMMHVAHQGLTMTNDLEQRACLAFADIEYEGIGLDKEAWLQLASDSAQKIDGALGKLTAQLMGDDTFEDLRPDTSQLDMFMSAAESVEKNARDGFNWSSPHQVLPVLQRVIPTLESCDGKLLEAKFRGKHPLVDAYLDYKAVSKLATTYGAQWIEKFLHADGKAHTNFNQVLNTGRVSSSGPNMQQLPANNAYRNCFVAPEGWSFVSTDYSSQELAIIATASGDPVWLDALEQGQDLHSVCAALVFGQQWEDAAEPACEFAKSKQKCNCPEHKRLRNGVKAINFGLAYGMGAGKLADTLDSSKEYAKELIEDYFRAFPSIKKFLDGNGKLGIRKGFITTFGPFSRKRFFGNWTRTGMDKADMGAIERRSKNTPIQGCGADMTKLALVYLREVFEGHEDEVRLVLTVHDEINCIVRDDVTDKWSDIIQAEMERAAKYVLKNDLLKAEPETTKAWSK